MLVAELEKKYPGFWWRYLDHGTRKHALRHSSAATEVHDGLVSECQLLPSWFRSWLGTGNQAEYERNDELPECNNCLRKVDKRVAEESAKDSEQGDSTPRYLPAQDDGRRPRKH